MIGKKEKHKFRSLKIDASSFSFLEVRRLYRVYHDSLILYPVNSVDLHWKRGGTRSHFPLSLSFVPILSLSLNLSDCT